MVDYEKHPNTIFRAADKEFVVHPTSILQDDFDDSNTQRSLTPPPFRNPREHSSTGPRRGSVQPVTYRHTNENPIDAVRRREIRRAILSSPSYGGEMSPANEERFSAITDSSDYRESGLKKLKSNSWESIARWEKENEFLFTLIEDECDWLKRLFPEETITAQTFFKDIEDGVLLCKLSQLCQRYAEETAAENNTHVPLFPIYIHSRKKCQGGRGKFMRRENVELFLKWCRLQQIPEPLLFESNDVVERTEEEGLRENAREIVLCLMEVARLGVKFGIEPPQLILLEKEIELEEQMDSSIGSISPISVDSGVDTMDMFQYGSLDAQSKDATTNENSDEEMDDNYGKDIIDAIDADKSNSSLEGANDGDTYSKYDGDKHLLNDSSNKKQNDEEINNKDNKNRKSKDKRKKQSSNKNRKSDSRRKKSNADFPKTELHNKVASITEAYNILKITRLKEGKYIILGKVMFVRLLNNHCLVRIGGGWDTLEHYVITHVNKVAPDSFEQDPADVIINSASNNKKTRKTSSNLVKKSFLAKSSPNLLSLDEPESVEIATDNQKSNEISRPTSTTPSSKDPYFVEKRLKKSDDRKITQAILKVQANLKRAASLDWTNLKEQELNNIQSFSKTFEPISQENIDQIKNMADVAIETRDVLDGEDSQQVNGDSSNAPDLAVPISQQNGEISGEIEPVNNISENKPNDVTAEPIVEVKENPKIKKSSTKAVAPKSTRNTTNKPLTSRQKPNTASKATKSTVDGTNRASSTGRMATTITRTKPSQAKPTPSTTRVKSTTSKTTPPAKTKTSTTTTSSTSTHLTSKRVTSSTTASRTSASRSTAASTSRTATTGTKTTSRPVTSTATKTSTPKTTTSKTTTSKPTASKTTTSKTVSSKPTTSKSTAPKTTTATKTVTKTQSRITTSKPADASKSSVKPAPLKVSVSTAKPASRTSTRAATATKPGTAKTTATKPSSTRTTKTASSDVTKKPKSVSSSSPKTLSTSQTKKVNTAKKTTVLSKNTAENKSKKLPGNKASKEKKSVEKKDTTEPKPDEKINENNIELSAVDTLIVVPTGQVIEPEQLAVDTAQDSSNLPDKVQEVDNKEDTTPVIKSEHLIDDQIVGQENLIDDTAPISCSTPDIMSNDSPVLAAEEDTNVGVTSNDDVVTQAKSESFNGETMTSSHDDEEVLLVINEVKIPKDEHEVEREDNSNNNEIEKNDDFVGNDVNNVADINVTGEPSVATFTLIPHDEVKEYDSEDEDDEDTGSVQENVLIKEQTVETTVSSSPNMKDLGGIESSSITSFKGDIVRDGNAAHTADPTFYGSTMAPESDADLYCVTPLVSGNFDENDFNETSQSDVSPMGSPVKSSLDESEYKPEVLSSLEDTTCHQECTDNAHIENIDDIVEPQPNNEDLSSVSPVEQRTVTADMIEGDPSIEPIPDSEIVPIETAESESTPSSTFDEDLLQHNEVQPVSFPVDEPGLPVEEPGLLMEEPGLSIGEPGLPVEEPGLSVEEPELSVEEPGMSMDEAGLPVEEPGLPEEEPKLSVEELELLVEEPGLLEDKPALPVEESELPVEDPGLLKDELASQEKEDSLEKNKAEEIFSINADEEQSMINKEIPEDLNNLNNDEIMCSASEEVPISFNNFDGKKDDLCSDDDGLVYSEDRMGTPLPSNEPELQSPCHSSLNIEAVSDERDESLTNLQCEDFQTTNAADNQPTPSDVSEGTELPTEELSLEQDSPPAEASFQREENGRFEAWSGQQDVEEIRIDQVTDDDHYFVGHTIEEICDSFEISQQPLFEKREMNADGEFNSQSSMEGEATAKAVDIQCHDKDILSDSDAESMSSQSPNHHVVYTETKTANNCESICQITNIEDESTMQTDDIYEENVMMFEKVETDNHSDVIRSETHEISNHSTAADTDYNQQYYATETHNADTVGKIEIDNEGNYI